MKVLWISAMPCGANKIINPNYVLGGWLGSLENVLKADKEIELHECYLCNKPMKEFVYEGVYNYPIYDSFYSSKKYFIVSQLSFLFNHLFSDKRIPKITEIVNKVKPDIIHIHGSETEIGTIQRSIQGIPVVLSLQGIITPYRGKLYAGIPYTEVKKRDSLIKFFSLRSSIYQRNSWNLYKKREKTILLDTRNIIGRTNWDRRVASVLAPQATYYYGSEILRRPFYECAPWNKSSYNKTFTIVSIVTGGLYKGFETILQTAETLNNIHFDFKWIVIGQTNSSQNTILFENYTGVECKNSNISLVGNKTPDEIIKILRDADLYCHVSHIENSPNSICEAMLIGMPVVATMAGGTDTIIEHNRTGVLFQEGENYSLAGLIVELSKDFDKAKSMAEEGRKVAMRRHDPELIARQYIDIYKSIVNNYSDENKTNI